ncbi:MAG: Rpn family recombination-promoting nuclease/putative transposase, partial [bacterium]|nr:Rpn family recombination-promoting nuclease/putative transposase [bacterium]
MKTNIDKVHDKFFKTLFRDPERVKLFLRRALPEALKKRIDLSELIIDTTNYVSDLFKETISDIIAKTTMATPTGKRLVVDIYFLFEHK